MRGYLFAALGCLVIVGCAPRSFPTPQQNAAALAFVQADKFERIKPDVLAGMWVGDKGSVLTFGPGHNISSRTGTKGSTLRGTYHLEHYKLFLDTKVLGQVILTKPDQFMLAQSKAKVEHFRKIA